MAILRLSDGRILTSFEGINRMIAPMVVGAFDGADDMLQLAQSMPQPLSQDDALAIFGAIPASQTQAVADAGLSYSRVAAAIPNADGSATFVSRTMDSPAETATPTLSEEQMRVYRVPHHVMAREWHFVFTGAVVKGVYISNELQGVVYCPAGNWMQLDSRVISWVMLPRDEATIAAGFFDTPCDTGFEMRVREDIEVLPAMRF